MGIDQAIGRGIVYGTAGGKMTGSAAIGPDPEGTLAVTKNIAYRNIRQQSRHH